MMLYIRLFVWILFNISLFYILDNGIELEERSVLPIGKVLNPDNGVWKNAENAFSSKDIVLKNKDGKENIRIYFDERMVPHIFANSTADALFAQGYVEAYLRLWQMDFIQRAAGGRLSEVVGRKALKRDIRQRKSGMLWAAENAVESWRSGESYDTVIKPYIDGVNAFIAQQKAEDYAIEFKLLDYKPEKWTDLHSALILKSMTETLASYNTDIAATNSLNYLGKEQLEGLFPLHDPNQTPVVRELSESLSVDNPRVKPDSIDYTISPLENLTLYKGLEGIGSNNWALSAAKSVTGNSLLCNDPHLNLTLPSIWVETHIVTPQTNAYGVSIPGMPGIMIGFNENIAWGNTNVGHDFTDYYAIDWVDTSRSQYYVDGAKLQTEKRIESIKIKGEEDLNFDLDITVFGPVYADGNNNNNQSLARHWIGHLKHDLDETSVFVDIMNAQNYGDYLRASTQFFAPAQNFLYADRDTISLIVNGNLMHKYEREGMTVKRGASKAFIPDNYIARKDNPREINPARGFVSSANQESTGPDYPFPYHGSFEEYRGKRVNLLLGEKEKHGVEDMKEMQQDVYSLKAETFLPLMTEKLDSIALPENAQHVIEALTQWDFQYLAESTEAKYFHFWFSAFRKNIWSTLYDTSYTAPRLYPEDFVLLDILKDPDSEYRQVANLGAKDILRSLQESLQTTIDAFIEKTDLTWAEYRPKSIDHMLQIPAFSWSDLPMGGCGDVLNAISEGMGPSWRMVVELSEPTQAWVVYPGGQSGDPCSPFYDDSMQKWINGEYHHVVLDSDESNYAANRLFSIKFESKS